MYLTKVISASYNRYQQLPKDEKITKDCYVEDLSTGKREPVAKGYYHFLRGQKVEQALKLPNVFQIVRKA